MILPFVPKRPDLFVAVVNAVVGSTRSRSDALYADAFAFVLWRIGASGFQPG